MVNEFQKKIINIIAVLTCFNRKESTLECLRLLKESCNIAQVTISAIVVDDGSTDGTSEALLNEFDWVTVDYGDGSLFWNRGMHKGINIAERKPYDFLLWINDDTHLLPDAVARLISTYNSKSAGMSSECVVVGATADRVTKKITYSGQVSISKLRRFTYKKISSESQAIECETMNGNLVLIPRKVCEKVGNLDPVFEHAMGDIDYGLRVRKSDFKIFVAPGYLGYCSNNSTKGTYKDSSIPFLLRWKKMTSKKGLPILSWYQLTRKHGGLIWPLYFIWPYVMFWISAFSLLNFSNFKSFYK
jgi:GT2 family glycosyltransferase